MKSIKIEEKKRSSLTCKSLKCKMNQYTLDLYEYVNCYLNGEKFNKEDSVIYDKIIDSLDSSMYPSESDIVLYRGLPCKPILGLQKGYISTSKNLDVAKEYGDYILEIHVKKGTMLLDISEISYIKEEEEVIIARNSILVYDCDKIIVEQ